MEHTMHIMIDVAEAKFAFVLNSNKPAKCVEGDATVSRTYSALTLPQLQRLYRNTTGFDLACQDYSAALQTCKHLAIRLLTAKGGYAYDLEKEDG
jgi:hypothetical protein